MTRAAVALAVASVLVVGALSGCVTERSKAVPSIPGPFLARDPASGEGVLEPRPREAVDRPVPVSPAAVVPRAEVRGVAAPYAGHRPLPPGTSLEDRARERFLSAPTDVTAAQATLYVPERYAREASLSGASVVEEGAGRRTASGDGVLVLRRLTVRAARVTLAVRTDGKDDVQLTARGDVSLRSDQPASLVEERGLRALLLRNDAHTPLR